MSDVYEFGAFVLNPKERLLLCDGRPVSLTPKAFELFLVLVERGGSLVEKDDLLKTVWPDVAVEEGNLAVMVSHLRKVLGDDRETHSFIETVPRHGYRFVAPVTRRSESSSVSVAIATHNGNGSALHNGNGASHNGNGASHNGNGASHNGNGSALHNGNGASQNGNGGISHEIVPANRPLAPLELASDHEQQVARFPWLRRGGTYTLILLFICVAALVSWKLQRHSTAAASTRPIHSLAILPFQQIGAPNRVNYLGVGTADALITRLSGFNTLVVRPTSAIERYRKSALTPVQIGKQQSVDAVLEGLIQRQGDRVRLTVQLVRVRDGSTLWAESFNEKFTNIFSLEDEISERVAQSLRIQLSSAQVRHMSRKPTESPAAYDAYLKGRYFWNKRTKDSVERGLGYFHKAIHLDPNFADGYEGIADSYAILGLYGDMPPGKAFPAARRAAVKALSMDNSLADAHATLGLIYFFYDWDGTAAEDEFRHAISINPNYAMAHSWSGETLAVMGHMKAAIAESRRAMNDDPLSMIVNSNAGWTYYIAGQSGKAVQILQKAIALDPTFPRTHFRLGIIYQGEGHMQKAIQQFQKAFQVSDGNPYYQAALANAYGQAGNTQGAMKILQSLKNRARTEYVPAFDFALVYVGLHNKQDAFDWLQKASADHSTSMAFAEVDPTLASLRSDRRFAKVTQNLMF